MIIQCTYCGRELKEFSLEEEGDEMWVFALNDGEGNEGIMCETCFTTK